MPKTTAPTAAIASTSLSPNDLLTLARLDDLPEMAEVLTAKEKLAVHLAACEEALHTTRRQLAVYGAKGQNDPSTAAAMAQEATTKMHRLEREHAQTVALLRTANAEIATAREHEREKLMPTLAAMALPVIDRRLEDLAVLAMVARLLGAKAPTRTMRESHAQEKRYLEELKAVLTADPS